MSDILSDLSKLALWEIKRAQARVADLLVSSQWPDILQSRSHSLLSEIDRWLGKYGPYLVMGTVPQDIFMKRMEQSKRTETANFLSRVMPNFLKGRVRALEILRGEVVDLIKKYDGTKNWNTQKLSNEDQATIATAIIFCDDIKKFDADPVSFEIGEISSFGVVKILFGIVVICIFIILFFLMR